MSFAHTPSHASDHDLPKVRRIGPADVRWALAQGWRDFKAKRGDILIIAFVYPLIGVAASALTFNDRLMPLIFPLAAGLSILGPVTAVGFYELSRRREAGLDSSWRHFIDPVFDRRFWPLMGLAVVLMGLFLLWLGAAWQIYGETVGTLHPAGLRDFAAKILTTRQGLELILLGDGIGFIFAVVVLALSLVSVPMVVDRATDPPTAMWTSVRAVMKNPMAAATWGLTVAVLLALGSLPAFIGLAVVLPVLGYATWRLYTRIIEP